MNNREPLLSQDKDILGGTLVFRGTRVPVTTLFDYLSAGDALDTFLDDFPTVTREHALSVLEAAKGNISTLYQNE
jgi:uncharacterized protein (DUF433 family)